MKSPRKNLNHVLAPIKQLRKRLHLTQATVAADAGVRHQFIGASENGHPGVEFVKVMKVGAVIGLRTE